MMTVLDRKIGRQEDDPFPTPIAQPTCTRRWHLGVVLRSEEFSMRLVDVTYQQYINSHQWRRKRDERLLLDDRRCARCPSTERLEVHHLTYDRLGNERMDDLLTLCRECHARDHGRDPGLAPEAPASFYEDRFWEREGMLAAQEKIAVAAGVDITRWLGETE